MPCGDSTPFARAAKAAVTELKQLRDEAATRSGYPRRTMRTLRIAFLFSSALALASAQIPQATSGGGYALPNGWRLTPVGKSIPTADMVLNAVASPDGAAVIAMQAGYNPHGLVVIDTKTEEAVQRIPLKSAWYG